MAKNSQFKYENYLENDEFLKEFLEITDDDLKGVEVLSNDEDIDSIEEYLNDPDSSLEELCWETGNYTDCVCEICSHKYECSGYEERD